ncbi:MAG: GreA/GreB family elongation factor [Betaproteobacteria bacterium]
MAMNEDIAILARAADELRMEPNRAAMGSVVSYEELGTRTRRAVTLVPPGRANPAAGLVSVLSPVGRALLGRRAGEDVDARLPDGRSLQLRVARIGR